MLEKKEIHALYFSQGMMIILICLLIAFNAFALIRKEDYAKPLLLSASLASSDSNLEMISPIKPYDFYASQLERRDIFEAFPENPDPVLSGGFAQNFKILAIAVGRSSNVVIEDLRNQQRFFLEQGRREDNFEVQSVQRGHVVIKYQGKVFDIP